MKHHLKVFGCLCATEEFSINGIDADSSDFGEGDDISPETAKPYACGNRQFQPKMPTQEILDKYSITLSEYAEIASELQDRLSFGSCGWCV